MPKSTKKPCRTPQQSRARETCDVIFEATAQILETHGEGALTTNRIAERAGVSIGTIYQYFPNKQALLVALARREMSSLENNGSVRRKRKSGAEPGTAPLLHRYIHTLSGRPATRRAALKALLNSATPEELARSADATTAHMPKVPGATALDRFVMTRAITGVVRSAVLEGYDQITSPQFEAALLRLLKGYTMLTKKKSRVARK
ncbi:MAG: TetR/AcrR family transcriptional regulator [Micropepsaceae bacterium]